MSTARINTTERRVVRISVFTGEAGVLPSCLFEPLGLLGALGLP